MQKKRKRRFVSKKELTSNIFNTNTDQNTFLTETEKLKITALSYTGRYCTSKSILIWYHDREYREDNNDIELDINMQTNRYG